MKVTATNITAKYLQAYKLTKSIENSFKVDKLDGNVIYEGDDHKYLVTAASIGYENETGTIEKKCDALTFERNIVIKHSDGTFKLQNCQTDKKVHLVNTLDCIADNKINIFDYTISETKTLQGDQIRRSIHYNEVNRYENDIIDTMTRKTLGEVLSIVGGIPDRAFLGYFVENAFIDIQPKFEEVDDPQFGRIESYIYTTYSIYVTYVNINAATQITPAWKPTLGGGYHYVLPQDFNAWGPERITDYVHTYYPTGGQYLVYQRSQFELGRANAYVDRIISNTYFLNEILEDIFSCTGKTLVSNWFGINVDSTEPDNKYYTWANDYAKDVKIAQSYDIIRENALQDSFGKSGIIEVKKLLQDVLFIFNLMVSEEDDKIRLEHKTYYSSKGIDLTALDYEIDDIEMNRDAIDSEAFRYAKNFDNKAHYEAVFKYRTPNVYGQPNEQSKNTEKIVTDVFSAINNERFNESEYQDLFYLLLTDGTSIIGLNSPLAMPDLIQALHDIERPLKVAELEGKDGNIYFNSYSIGFSTTIKINSNVIMWQRLEPWMSVVTNEGTFLISELSIDQTDILEFKVKK